MSVMHEMGKETKQSPAALGRRLTLSVRLVLGTVVIAFVVVTSATIVSYIELRKMVLAVAETTLLSQVKILSNDLENRLSGLADDVRVLAKNGLISNALVDDLGRNVYLKGFLVGFQEAQGFNVVLTMADFEGAPIAGNGAPTPNLASAAWLSEIVEDEKGKAVIAFEGEHAYFIFAEPITYANTGTAEGVLVYQVEISDWLWMDRTQHILQENSLVAELTLKISKADDKRIIARYGTEPEKAPTASVKFMIPMSALGQSIELSLKAKPEFIEQPLNKLLQTTSFSGLFLLIAAASLAVLLVRTQTSKVIRLRRETELLKRPGSKDVFFTVEGNDEISDLANSFNGLVKDLAISRDGAEAVAKDLIQLIDTANAPIFGIDTTGLVNEWNQRAELLTGFAKADVMGKDLVAGFITDDYKASVEEVLDKALKGEESANYEFQLLNKSGDRIDVLLNSTSRRDANGNIIGVVGVGQDITELKFTQAQVIQSSKLATLGEMSTSVAHELNQPLNVIRMAAGNSRRKISKGTAGFEYLNAKLERIEEQTARAAAIIDHMRMFGRKAEEKHQSINPRLNVTNALDLMGEQLRLEGIEVVTEFSEDCSSIWGHSIQMEQVILNLLTNARDAMAESEGEGEKKITLRVFEDKVGVHITSQDTGGGIPEKVLPRIFEPFYTTKEMGKGTGLGLSVSYGIIREMKGTLIAENADAGARFTITVPPAAEYRFYGKS